MGDRLTNHDPRSATHDSEPTIHDPRLTEGVVVEALPSALYRVDVDGHRITAHIAGGLERNFVRLLVGDRVAVALTEKDLTRGRIVRKL
jgi:translation initiation factor IF-1